MSSTVPRWETHELNAFEQLLLTSGIAFQHVYKVVSDRILHRERRAVPLFCFQYPGVRSLIFIFPYVFTISRMNPPSLPTRDSRASSYPLLKFSYVTTVSPHGPFPWIHLTQQHNLIATFQALPPHGNHGSLRRQMFFQVAMGDTVLVRTSLFSLRFLWIHPLHLAKVDL